MKFHYEPNFLFMKASDKKKYTNLRWRVKKVLSYLSDVSCIWLSFFHSFFSSEYYYLKLFIF